jgi:hypothetical protein
VTENPVYRSVPVQTAGGELTPASDSGHVAERPPASPPRPLDATARAERWILGILLLEPHRWSRVQRHVHVDDFAADSVLRRLAELYWDYQRHEGEPVFNEFLGILGESDSALAEAAVESVDEVERLSSAPPSSPASADGDAGADDVTDRPGDRAADRPDRDQVLAEAVAHLERVRGTREGQKLLAELRRTTGGHWPEGAPENKERDEVVLLKQLQEKARQPDLRRV